MTHEEILTTLGHYVDYLIAGSTAEAPLWNIEKVRSGKPNKWNYIDGCMITACLSLYKTTGDEKYLNFSKSFIDSFVQEDGSIKTYDPKEYNLDNVNQGKNLFTLYDIFGDEKYRRAIDTIRSQLLTQPRTKEGNFWHKDIYPWQVWLDGTYMAQPFYMEYETRYNKMQGCIDSYKQFMNIKKHMRDEKTGLYYHGYDESRTMYWADPVTGCSPNFWLRAMGWFMVAMVDVLERMDEQLYNEYRGIMAMLKQTIEDVHQFQDEETGMFWQVMDHPGVEGNYLETSGTALFAYAVLKGVRLGYLPKRMAAWAGGAMESFSVRLINTGLARQFIIHMKTALCAGVLCASPYILYQLFRFVSPTLYDNERRYITQTVGVSSVMFGFGGQLLSDLSTDFSLFVNISGKW